MARDLVANAGAYRARTANIGVGATSKTAPSTDALEQLLTFTLADQEVAVPILRIREIVEFRDIRKVKTPEPWIRGWITVPSRPGAVPVIDLALKLGMPKTTVTRRTCFAIVEVEMEGEPTAIAWMIDAAARVLDLAAVDIAPPPVMGSKLRIEALQGVAKVGDELVLVLDVDRVVSKDELYQLAAARPTAGES